jgi:hypothetical protein
MDLQPWSNLLGQSGDAQILDNQGIGVGNRTLLNQGFDFLSFMIKGKGIHGDVDFDASGMAGLHRFWEVGVRIKIGGAGGKGGQTQINGIGTISNDSMELGPATT